MTRSRFGIGMTLGGAVAVWACAAAAETAYSAESTSGSFVKLLTERLEFTVRKIPALGHHLASLPDIVGGRTALLLLGIVVAGLAAEYAVRLLLNRARLRGFDRLVGHSPLRAFAGHPARRSRWSRWDCRPLRQPARRAASVAASSAVRSSWRSSTGAASTRVPRLAAAQHLRAARSRRRHHRAWSPGGAELSSSCRCSPDMWLARSPIRRTQRRGQRRRHPLCALRLGGLLWVVWHWRHEMAAWFNAWFRPRTAGRKIGRRGTGGYWSSVLCREWPARDLRRAHPTHGLRGLRTIESTLLLLLLFETLITGSRATSCRNRPWRATSWPLLRLMHGSTC